MRDHLVNHVRNNHQLQSDSTLYVVGVISNPVRYHSRYRLAREWITAMERTTNVNVVMVESIIGDRIHEVTDKENPRHLQLRTHSELWTKENQINLGVRHLLPRDWKYMAWIDCDIFFDNPDWAVETIHALQTRHVVQPWQDCVDLGPHGTILDTHKSFGSLNAQGVRRQKKPHEPYRFGHPGFVWACDRYFWENVGGLIDFAILGSADHHMACAMVNEVFTSMHDGMSKEFKYLCQEWQRKAFRVTQGHIGYVPGMIRHKFHGPKKRRYYRERWQILVDHDYNPTQHLYYDAQGVVQLQRSMHGLEAAIRRYNRSRFEDSIEEI